MKLINRFARNKKGRMIELTFALPFIIVLAYTLINVAQIYYTQNLLQNTVSDTATKLAILFRTEFFDVNNIRTETEFQDLMKSAIKQENQVSRLDFAFFDNEDGITIEFFELSPATSDATTTWTQDDSYAGALRLYLRPGLGQADIGYNLGASIPQTIQDNCSNPQYTMNFNEYRIKVTFKMPVAINLFGINSNYNLVEESSAILNQLNQDAICTAIGL